MNFDPAKFSPASVVDTCSIWNMLSSVRINQAALQARIHFCITPVVLYECLGKPRPTLSESQQELIKRFQKELAGGRFPIQECSLDDLVAITSKAPMRLGSGELSCIATAYRIRNIAVMTDDKSARESARRNFGLRVETTPTLYGYLHYHQHLGDADHPEVIKEHEHFEARPLTSFFEATYREAMRCRQMARASASPSIET